MDARCNYSFCFRMHLRALPHYMAAFFLFIFYGVSYGEVPIEYFQQFNIIVHQFTPDQGVVNSVNDICQDKSGYIWIAQSSGISRFDGKDFIPIPLDGQPKLPTQAYRIVEDGKGQLWAFFGEPKKGASTIYIIDPKCLTSKRLEQVYGSDLPVSIATITPYCINDDSNNLYMTTTNPSGLLKCSNQHKFSFYPFSSDEYIELVAYNQQQQLVARSSTSLMLIEQQGQIVQRTPLDKYNASEPFQSSDLVKIFFRTTDNHILVVDSKGKGTLLPNALGFNQDGISISSSLAWVNTQVENSVGKILSDFKQLGPLVNTLDGVVTLLDRSGSIWVATPTQMYRFSVSPQLLVKNTSSDIPASLGDSKFVSDDQGIVAFVYPSIGNNQIIGTSNGIYLWESTTGRSSLISSDFGSAYYIHKDKSNCYWVATEKGIVQLIGRTLRPIYGGLPNDTYYYIHEDSQGLFWFGTANNGLVCWDPKRNSVVHSWSKYDGFPSDCIYSIYEDMHQRLWLSSNEGIIQFEKLSGLSFLFYQDDSIVSFLKQKPRCVLNKDLSISYLSGKTEVAVSKEALDYKVVKNIPVVIKEIKVLNQTNNDWIDISNCSDLGKGIELEAAQNKIRFSLVLPEGQNDKNIRLAYWVDGVDVHWNYPSGNKVEVRLPGYGEYLLRVRACDGQGNWSEEVCHLPVKVKLSFKEKGGMAVLFIVLSVIALFLLFRVLLSFKRKEKNTRPLNLLDNVPTVDKKVVTDEGNNQVFLEYAEDTMAIPNEGSKYLSEEDRIWLIRLDEILLREIGNNKFDMEAVAKQLNMSRSSFYRKMQKVSDLSPKEYHNRFRFEYAKVVLETRKHHSVKAVAYAIGMRDVEYFSKMYKKQYGRSPSDWFP